MLRAKGPFAFTFAALTVTLCLATNAGAQIATSSRTMQPTQPAPRSATTPQTSITAAASDAASIKAAVLEARIAKLEARVKTQSDQIYNLTLAFLTHNHIVDHGTYVSQPGCIPAYGSGLQYNCTTTTQYDNLKKFQPDW